MFLEGIIMLLLEKVFANKKINEEKLLELYNALSGRNYPEGTPIKIITLEKK